jgi:hypothetical protein
MLHWLLATTAASLILLGTYGRAADNAPLFFLHALVACSVFFSPWVLGQSRVSVAGAAFGSASLPFVFSLQSPSHDPSGDMALIITLPLFFFFVGSLAIVANYRWFLGKKKPDDIPVDFLSSLFKPRNPEKKPLLPAKEINEN